MAEIGMPELLEFAEANWIALAVAALVVLLLAWWLLARARRPAWRSHRPDVLDEGFGRAQRNQALIDAPSAAMAAVTPAPAGEAMAGIGEVVALAAQAASDDFDDLTRIKGLGPKLATILQGLGITGFAQIAAWDEGDIERIDAKLGTFAGRIRRDAWVEQARHLAGGDTAGFEAKFGRL
jgi:predicted flap endonuclease-1-like 5' DNA nuclease